MSRMSVSLWMRGPPALSFLLKLFSAVQAPCHIGMGPDDEAAISYMVLLIQGVVDKRDANNSICYAMMMSDDVLMRGWAAVKQLWHIYWPCMQSLD